MDIDSAIAKTARAALLAVEPLEAPIMDELLAPPRWWQVKSSSNAVGFGVTDVEPAAATVLFVSGWYAQVWYAGKRSRLSKWLKKRTEKILAASLGALLDPPDPAVLPLSAEQMSDHADRVARLAIEQGMSKKQARVLGTAVVAEMIMTLAADGDD